MGAVVMLKYASEILCNNQSRDEEYCLEQEYNYTSSQTLITGKEGNIFRFALCSLHVKHISKDPRTLSSTCLQTSNQMFIL